jgi:hypothetical protein
MHESGQCCACLYQHSQLHDIKTLRGLCKDQRNKGAKDEAKNGISSILIRTESKRREQREDKEFGVHF